MKEKKRKRKKEKEKKQKTINGFFGNNGKREMIKSNRNTSKQKRKNQRKNCTQKKKKVENRKSENFERYLDKKYPAQRSGEGFKETKVSFGSLLQNSNFKSDKFEKDTREAKLPLRNKVYQ